MSNNGHKGERCSCDRCRRHDLLFSVGVPTDRPLSPREFVEIFGVPEPAEREPWGPEIEEAELAADVARVELNQTRETWLDLRRRSEKDTKDPSLALAAGAAREELRRAEDDWTALNVRAIALKKAESHRRAFAEYEATQEAKRKEAAKTQTDRRKAGAKLLALVRGEA